MRPLRGIEDPEVIKTAIISGGIVPGTAKKPEPAAWVGPADRTAASSGNVRGRKLILGAVNAWRAGGTHWKRVAPPIQDHSPCVPWEGSKTQKSLISPEFVAE